MKKLLLMAAAGFAFAVSPAGADTCTGTCGVAGANGVVTPPPSFGPGYKYVSTANGVNGAGQIAGIGGTNGSELVTSAFTVNAGDVFNFNFNYVTSDGAGYSDYAFAELLSNGNHAAWLFTARTTVTGDTSPGFELPANDSVLNPGTTPINAGGPVWDQLGQYSGACFDDGCGYTGWIGSSYTFATGGSYQVRLGVANFDDELFDSGLAFAGLTVNDVPIENPPVGAVPEPASWAMMIGGVGMAGGALRRRRRENAKLAVA